MKLKFLLLVLALQTAWILATAFVQERALTQGQLILLETRPADPRDLLRGDYVILNYKISDVPMDAFSPPVTVELPAGRTIYVLLEKRGEFYEVASAATEKLSPAGGQVMLRGTSQYWWNSAQQKSVRVEYGLERYYVREGTGNPRGKLTVQVSAPASGHGAIKQVFVEGKPYAEAMKEAAK